MKSFKEIVVGIDFADASRKALRHAAQIAREEGARLVAVHVITATEVEDYQRGFRVPTDEMLQSIRESVARLAKEELGSTDSVAAEAVVGAPYHELVRCTENGQCDLLVLGSRGEESGGHQIGFFAAKCVRHARVPILLARSTQALPVNRVVACIDFSESSREVLSTALRVAADEGASLDVVHAVRPPWDRATHVLYNLDTVEDDDFKSQYRGLLEGEMEAALASAGTVEGVVIESHVIEHPSPDQAIVTFLKETNADLVVVGRSGHTAKILKHYLIGTTAERLIHRSPCSVLTVPCIADDK